MRTRWEGKGDREVRLVGKEGVIVEGGEGRGILRGGAD